MGFIIPNMGIESEKPNTIANALFSSVQQRVLGILFGQPDRSFYANEVIKLAASGTGAVQRELRRLEAAGLVTATRRGNQKHYQANRDCPVFDELRGLMLKTTGLTDVLRAALHPLAGSIHAAFVYGSVAKRTDTASSDIDLMVISDSLGHGELFAVLDEAIIRLGRTVNPTVYTRQELARRRRKKNAFLTRVLAQSKLWLYGGEDDLAS